MPPKQPKNVEDKTAQVKADEKYSREVVHMAMLLWAISERGELRGVTIKRISIRMPDADRGDALVTVAGTLVDGSPVVCFTAGRYADDALVNALYAIDKEEVNWREDRFAS